jgi:hypothetical protein
VKVFRNRWQFELKIVRRIIPDLGAFEEALEGPFLILSNWYCLCCRRRTPRTSQGMSVAFIDESRQMTVISLGLRVVNLRSSGRQRHKGASTVRDLEPKGQNQDSPRQNGNLPQLPTTPMH